MEKRRLGNSDMEVSVISLGAWAYGKVARWGVNVDEKGVMKTVHRAVDLGINLIDTAPAYGESEEMVGVTYLNKTTPIYNNKIPYN